MAAGKSREACEAFEASQAADASVGALLNVARCHEQDGKLAMAWAEYRAAATLAGQRGEEERGKGALELARALEQRLPRLTVDVLPQQADVSVSIDGEDLPAMSHGLPIPVDPGEHVVAARASGYDSWRSSLTIAGDGSRTTVVVPPLVPTESADPVTKAPSGRAQRTAAFVVGGVGLAGVVVGAVQATRAFLMDRNLDRTCAPLDVSGKRACGATSGEAIDELRVTAHSATGLLIGGGALTVVGAALWWSTPATAPPVATWSLAPSVGPSHLGLVAAGRF